MFQRTRNYAKDYEHIGSTVHYRGKHYRFAMERPELTRRKTAYAALLLAALALFAAAGFSGAPALGAGGGQAPIYVMLPYVVLLLPLGLGLARAVMLALISRPLEFAEYDKYLVRQKAALLAALILGCATVAGMAAFSFFAGADASAHVLALAETVLCTACIFFALRQHHALFACVTIDE